VNVGQNKLVVQRCFNGKRSKKKKRYDRVLLVTRRHNTPKRQKQSCCAASGSTVLSGEIKVGVKVKLLAVELPRDKVCQCLPVGGSIVAKGFR
jgi:hypothetical protein